MYKATIRAAYIGNLVAALVTNLPPLLFVTFMNYYGLTYEQVGRLILINFLTQIVSDLVNSRFVDRYGVRPFITSGHLLVTAGFLLFSASPVLLPSNPYIIMMISTVIFSYGGGLLELLLSAIIGSIPSDQKAKDMSLLHSFYAWGFIIVVLATTFLLALAGPKNWQMICILWAFVPLANFFLFLKVPLAPIAPHGKHLKFRTMIRSPFFLLILLGIAIGGASEVTMSQWISTFAETSLHLDKTTGDLAGVLLFAFFLGLGRLLYGKYGKDEHIWSLMLGGSFVALACYIVAGTSRLPYLSLGACILCGMGVSLLWPGSIVLAQNHFPHASAGLFALLAASGDTGAAVGPYVVSIVSDWQKILGSSRALQTGLLFASLFPFLMLLILCMIYCADRRSVSSPKGQEATFLKYRKGSASDE
ncbi:MAG: MFS transporter [Sphaerochaetaceae bacterium]|nr:MFS transporter [Sphaerochaetaceae bacterium]